MRYGIGIDVSKGKSTVSVISEDYEIILTPFEFTHDIDGISELLQKIKKFPKEECKIVLEHTGIYHLPVMCTLINEGYFVVGENAFKIKKYLDRDIRKAKTDKKDSLKLAEYAIENWNRLIQTQEIDKTYNTLKFLSRQYLELTSMKIKGKVNFSNLCDMIFPGYYQLLNDNNFELGIRILQKYSHPSLITQKEQALFVNEIDTLAKSLGHKSAGRTLAYKVFDLAQKTISSYDYDEYIQLSVQKSTEVLIELIKSTNEIISKIDELASTLPEYKIINEMPGCGKKLTGRLIAEIGDVRRFKNAGSLIAYAGLDVPPYQSGKFKATEVHISKRGNKYLRKTGYELMKCIKSSCKESNEVLDYILKKETEGKCKKSAKIAGLNKFLRIYYGSVKNLYKKLEETA